MAIDGSEAVFVRLSPAKEVEGVGTVVRGQADRVIREDAAQAGSRPTRVPPALVGGERVLPRKAVEHSDDRTATSRDDGRGPSPGAGSSDQLEV